MENNTKSEPKTILCCFVKVRDFWVADLGSVFLSGVAVFIVFAILG
jgi:hypothetical protein